MSNVYAFASRKERQRLASEWLAKIDRGLEPEEQRLLDSWLAADAQNPEALLEVAGLWDKLDSLSRLADLFPRQETVSRQSLAGLGRSPVRLPFAWAAAAVLVLSLGVWLADFSPGQPQPAPGVEALADQESFETSVGQRSVVHLADGSVLTLNTNSLVRADFTPGSRLLVLERGEVHVKVAHDSARPFRVLVGNRYVEAVGTEFNLEITSDQRVELIVTEGKVLVGVHQPAALAVGDALSGNEPAFPSETASTILLGAGKKAMLDDPEGDVETLEPEEIEVRLSWRGGNLVFRGESLVDAINEIERYTEVEFVIQDESLKQVRVAGMFKAGDVEGLLTTLKQNFNVDHQRVGQEQIILTSRAEMQ
jgi:transmembrane sensor